MKPTRVAVAVVLALCACTELSMTQKTGAPSPAVADIDVHRVRISEGIGAAVRVAPDGVRFESSSADVAQVFATDDPGTVIVVGVAPGHATLHAAGRDIPVDVVPQ